MSSTILYPAGTIISSNYPLIHVLANDLKSKYCDHCFKESSSLKKCSGCGKMYYCNMACQKLDWKGKHKHECSSANFSDLDTVQRFVNRLDLAMRDRTSLHRKFYLRPSNQNAGGELKSFTLLDLCIQTQGSDEIMLETPHKIIKQHSRPIQDENFITIGCGLYVAEACLTGYSCAPNAVPSFTGTRANLRSMTDLRVGQPITTGMGLCLTPRIERRALLLNDLGIDCHCEMCDEDWENDIDCEAYARMDKRIAEYLRVVDECDHVNHLQEYTILLKHFYVALKKRFKHHHPLVSQWLSIIFCSLVSIKHDSDTSVFEFDQLYPDLLKALVESLKITHDPSHKLWDILRDFKLENERQVPNLKLHMRLLSF